MATGRKGAPLRAETLPAPHGLVAAGICLATAGVPLAWSTAFLAEYTIPKLLALVAGILLAAVGAVLSARRGAAALPATALDRPLLAAAVALGASALASQSRLLSVFGRHDSFAYGLWSLALYAALFYLAAGLLAALRRTVLRLDLCVGGIVGAYAILQGFGLELFAGVGKLPSGRAVSTLGSPVDLGAFLGLLLPLGLRWTFAESNERVLGVLCSAAMAGGLLATVSRGAWAGAALGCAVYLALAGRLRVPAWSRLRWAGAACLAAGLLAVSVQRLAARPRRSSDQARKEVWLTAWRVFLDRPWLGTGPDTFEVEFRRARPESYVRWVGTERFQAYAHNDILQALATTGLAGTWAYLWLWGALVLAARRALGEPAERETAAALSGGLAALFFDMKFNPVALEVLVQAVLFCGLLSRAPGADGNQRAAVCGWEAGAPGAGALAQRWAPAAVVLAFALASAARVLRLAAADAHAHRARAFAAAKRPDLAWAAHERALKLNPCELSYAIQLVNLISDRINATPLAQARLELLDRAAAAGSQAVACHPSGVNSHYIHGIAGLMRGQLGLADGWELARRELDEALRWDPHFMPLLHSRLAVASQAGDAAEVRWLRERIERLTALTQEAAESSQKRS